MTTIRGCERFMISAKEDAQLTKHMHQATLTHFENTLSKLEERAKLLSGLPVSKETTENTQGKHRLTGLVQFLQSSS